MDNTRGEFEPISQERFIKQMQKLEPFVFKVGEIIEIRGSRLRVKKIRRNNITFKLLPKLKQ